VSSWSRDKRQKRREYSVTWEPSVINGLVPEIELRLRRIEIVFVLIVFVCATPIQCVDLFNFLSFDLFAEYCLKMGSLMDITLSRWLAQCTIL